MLVESGCSAVCPDGTLIGHKGNRYVVWCSQIHVQSTLRLLHLPRRPPLANLEIQNGLTPRPRSVHSLVLSNTTELHAKIEQLSNRIRELEDALAKLHTGTSDEPHPLLRQELLMLKLPPGVHTTSNLEPKRVDDIVADAFGTLQIADDGGGAFFGGTAGSEFYLEDSEVRGALRLSDRLLLTICLASG
jgi:hypothetical protein